MADRPENLMIEHANVMFRNFAGREAPFNSEGDRNFVVFINPDLAEKLEKEGWKVKRLRPRDDEPDPQAYLPVAVSYKQRPPRIVLLTNQGKKRNEMGIDDVPLLDFADVSNWDLIINPYPWEVNGNTGIKAYLKTAFVTLNEDPLELKYATEDEDQDPTASLTANDPQMVEA